MVLVNIKIFLGHSKQNLKNATIVVVSSAIKKNNPELIEAKKKKIPIIKRGKMLASIVSLMKNIVVVGSHGKTTTTSNIGMSLARLGHPTLLIDADVGLRNLDLLLGLENRIVYTGLDVLNETCRLEQASYSCEDFAEQDLRIR